MRKGALLVSIPLLSIVIFISIIWNGRTVKAVNVKYNIKDLPEHGLFIVGPADPSFDGMMTTLVSGKSKVPIDALKPISFFMKNISKRLIIAYKFKWEFLYRDGTTRTKLTSYANTWVLMNGAGENQEVVVAQDKDLIRPKSTWFFSLASLPQPLEEAATDKLGSGQRTFTDQNLAGKYQQAIQEGNEEALIESINNEMEKYSEITISLDGVFFDDGTFVGADTTNFFAETKAQVDARYDLLREMEDDLRLGKPAHSTLKRSEELVNAPDIDLDPASPLIDRYNFFKKQFAKGPLSTRDSLGDDESIKRELKLLSKPWPKLRKL